MTLRDTNIISLSNKLPCSRVLSGLHGFYDSLDAEYKRSMIISESGYVYFRSDVLKKDAHVVIRDLKHYINDNGIIVPDRYRLPSNWYWVTNDLLDSLHSSSSKMSSGMSASDSELADRFLAILEEAVNEKATDVHVICSPDPDAKILFTVDKINKPIRSFAFEDLYAMISAFYATYLKNADGDFQPSIIQDASGNNFKLKSGKTISIRYAHVPRHTSNPNSDFSSFKATIRVLGDERNEMTLDSMGYLKPHKKILRRYCETKKGGFIMAGTTNSGKSTTNAVLIDSSPEDFVVYTIEDPVEIVLNHPMASQIQATKEGGMIMQRIVENIMRQAPNLVSVGELRDEASVNSYVQLGQTGHRVHGTTHADRAELITERLSRFVDVQDLASTSVLSVLGYQALLPKLCEHCRLPANEPSTFNKLKNYYDGSIIYREAFDYVHGHGSTYSNGIYFRNPQGCKSCDPNNTQPHESKGIKGLVLQSELIKIEEEDCFFIKNKDIYGWRKHLIKNNFKPLEYHALQNVYKGSVCPVNALVNTPAVFQDEKQQGVFIYEFESHSEVFKKHISQLKEVTDTNVTAYRING